jgi:protein TonB
MTYAGRLLVCAACSVGGHVLVSAAAARLPVREDARPGTTLEVQVVEVPTPEPEPVTPPPEVEPPEPVVKKTVKAAAPRLRQVPPAGPVRPPPPAAAPAAGTAAPQVFSSSMTATSSSQGNGPEVPSGTAAHGPAVGGGGPASGRPDGALVPAPAYEVTRMPMPEGKCAGRYTDEARESGTEGTVVLDVVVDEQGRTRDIAVVHGLDHGLSEAAVSALSACRFSPGERNGKPVAVRIRTFKISFYLQGD